MKTYAKLLTAFILVVLYIPIALAVDSSGVRFCTGNASFNPSEDDSDYLYMNLNGTDEFTNDAVVTVRHNESDWLTAYVNTNDNANSAPLPVNITGEGIYIFAYDMRYKNVAKDKHGMFSIGESPIPNTYYTGCYNMYANKDFDKWLLYDASNAFTDVELIAGQWENWTYVIDIASEQVDVYHYNNTLSLWELEIDDRLPREDAGAMNQLNAIRAGGQATANFDIDNIRLINGSECPEGLPPPDITPPVITIDYPTVQNVTYNDVPMWINISTDEPSNCSINTTEWVLDGASTDTTFYFEDNNATALGDYHIIVSCNDSVINNATEPLSFSIDRENPFIDIHTISKLNTTLQYNPNLYLINVTLTDDFAVNSYVANISLSNGTVLWSYVNYTIGYTPYPFSELVDSSTWINTTYIFDNQVQNGVNSKREQYEFEFEQPLYPHIIIDSPTDLNLSIASGGTYQFNITTQENNTLDSITREWYVDNVLQSGVEDYEHTFSGVLDTKFTVDVIIYDNSDCCNYSYSRQWNVTITSVAPVPDPLAELPEVPLRNATRIIGSIAIFLVILGVLWGLLMPSKK